MMHAGFLAVLFGGWAYFGFVRRQFDLPALAYACATIYFLPGVLGYVSIPVASIGVWIEQPIHEGAYGVFTLVLAAILAAGWACGQQSGTPSAGSKGTLDAHLLTWVVLGAAVLGFLWTLAVHGRDLLLPKEVLLPTLSRGYVLWSEGATFGAILAYVLRKPAAMWVACLLLAADMFLGFRTATAISLIAMFFLWISRQEQNRLILSHWKKSLLILPAGFFLLLYKQVMAVIKLGRWDLLWDNLTNPSVYEMAVFQSEPFGTQSILHEVLRQHFHTDPGQLLTAFSNALPFGNVFMGDPKTFNDLFQPTLYPGLESGLANNFWAQMWSVGGWSLLALAAACFGLLLVVGNRCLKQASPALLAFWAYFWMYFAFYIHRNDLAYQLYLQRRVFLYALAFAAATGLLQGLRSIMAPR